MIPGGQSVVIECWILLAVVLVVYICRIISRRILLGAFRKLQIDDYLMTFTVVLFVIVTFSIWLQCLWGNNYVTPEEIVGWTKNDFRIAIKGAKWGVAMETCKVSCVWGCKACLLILYSQMTKGLPKYHRAVKIVAVYVAVGYIIVMTFFFGVWCHPFHAYYDVIPVPPSEIQCMTYRHHMILDACLNITSDAVMLCLPIPLVLKAKIPLPRKIALAGVFSLGLLVIVCAMTNRITNFSAPTGSLQYLNWYEGEITTAVIVANVPHLWPLISRVSRFGAFKSSSGPSGSNQYVLNSRRSAGAKASARRTRHDIEGYIPTGSEERIAGSDDKDVHWRYSKTLDAREWSDQDLELGNGYMTTKIHGGQDDKVGIAVGGQEDKDAPTDHKIDPSKTSIIKTVQLNQYTDGI